MNMSLCHCALCHYVSICHCQYVTLFYYIYIKICIYMKKSAKKSVGWAKKGKITEKLQKKLWRGDAILLYL